MKSAFFLLVAAILILAGFAQESYSEYLSPKKQLDSGVSPEDVTCRDGKVLVLRANGDVACVTERTAQKVGWEIIKTEFENTFDENLLNSISFDLSGIKTQSNVLEGDYETGLYTESMKGVIRAPPPSPFATSINYVVNQDGSSDFSKMDSLETRSAVASFSSSESKIKTPDEYLKYFPEYIPDGQELKFFTFEGHELGARLHLVYAPIVISVDPLELTMEYLDDIGGIRILIEDTPDTWHDRENAFAIYKERGYTIDNENYLPHTVIHPEDSMGYVMWENESGITFSFNSMSYTGTELLIMAETALNQN